MEESPIPTRILYLDLLILLASAYPARFGATLGTLVAGWGGGGRGRRQGGAPESAVAMLPWLVAPLALLVLATWMARPELLRLSVRLPWVGLALALAAIPLAFFVEYLVTAAATYRPGMPFFRAMALQPFWQGRLRVLDHGLLVLIAVGEELIYRQIWLGSLIGTFGLPPLVALGLSSFAYGLNHLYFGPLSVATKTLMGLIYGGLFLYSGNNIWVPIVAHVLQNGLLLALTARANATTGRAHGEGGRAHGDGGG